MSDELLYAAKLLVVRYSRRQMLFAAFMLFTGLSGFTWTIFTFFQYGFVPDHPSIPILLVLPCLLPFLLRQLTLARRGLTVEATDDLRLYQRAVERTIQQVKRTRGYLVLMIGISTLGIVTGCFIDNLAPLLGWWLAALICSALVLVYMGGSGFRMEIHLQDLHRTLRPGRD